MAIEWVFTGKLPDGYLGHVAYSMKLPDGLERLSATLALERLEPTVAPSTVAPSAHARDTKNEIHLEAFLNGVFIGGLHKQRISRTLSWARGADAAMTPEGCLALSSLEGMLTVQMPVFNVLEGVGYTLSICGE